jgi:tetratricopeptide (TPR) repeat protein
VRLDGHPLALATAGAFLKQSAVSFAEYLQQYDAKWQVVDSIDELPDYPTRTLYTTWNLSFIQIERENMRAACLLKLFAYLDNQDIWYDLLSGACKESNLSPWFLDVVSDRFTFEDAIGVLKKFCLVEAHYQTGSYSLHVCVHDWTLNGLSRGVDLDLYQLALRCIACHIIADWENLSSQEYSRFAPHASRLAHGRFLKCPDLQHLFQKESYKIAFIAELLYRQGQFIATESIQELLLASQEKALGAEHTSTLYTVNNLGILYKDQGKLVDAEKMYKRALRGNEAALGTEHTLTLYTVNNLGILYKDQGKLADAEKMYKRALQGNEAALGTEHTSTLNTVNNLGNLYYNQGKLADAEKMYKRALRGYEKVLGKDKAMTYIPALNTIWNFGSLFGCQNDLVNAKIIYSRALVGYEKVVGRDHSKSSSLRDKLYTLDNVRE